MNEPYFCMADRIKKECRALDGTIACMGPHSGTKIKHTEIYLECFSKKERKRLESRIGEVLKIYGVGLQVQWYGEEGPTNICYIDIEEIK